MSKFYHTTNKNMKTHTTQTNKNTNCLFISWGLILVIILLIVLKAPFLYGDRHSMYAFSHYKYYTMERTSYFLMGIPVPVRWYLYIEAVHTAQ